VTDTMSVSLREALQEIDRLRAELKIHKNNSLPEALDQIHVLRQDLKAQKKNFDELKKSRASELRHMEKIIAQLNAEIARRDDQLLRILELRLGDLREASEYGVSRTVWRFNRFLSASKVDTPDERARTARNALAIARQHPEKEIREGMAIEVANYTRIAANDLLRIAERPGLSRRSIDAAVALILDAVEQAQRHKASKRTEKVVQP
jgi:hypothetical protein